MHKKRITALAIVGFLLISSLFNGCGKKDEKTTFAFAPEVTWDTTIEQMVSLKGESSETYASVYGGTTYTYECTYLERNGTLKLMFNEKDELMSVAWACGTETIEELGSLYEQIHTPLEKTYGKSDYNAKGTGSGDVWYLESGDVLITTMATESLKALQFAYLHPDVSGKAK